MPIAKLIAELLRLAVFWAALGLAALVMASGLMLAGFGGRFAHMCGYAVALIAGIVLVPRVSPGDASVKGYRSGVFVMAFAAAYMLSFATLTTVTERLSVSPYLIHLLAAVVFVGAAVVLDRLIPAVLDLLSPWISRRWIGYALFVAVVAMLSWTDVRTVVGITQTVDQRAAIPTYGRVQSWLDAAECFKKTGVILVHCEASGLTPVENVNLGDDRGHGMILSVLHKWFGVPATRAALVVINALYVGFSLLLLGVQLYRMGFRVASALFFLFALRYAGDGYLFADSYGAYYGVFALSALLPLQILHMGWRRVISLGDWLWLGVAVLATVLVTLTREPFGYIGVVVSLLAIGCVVFHAGRSIGVRHAAVAAVGFVALLAAANVANGLFAFRAKVQGIPIGVGSLSHGIGHNLYIGLGSQPNSFGIKWDDGSGANAVKAAKPDAGYVTDEYYRVIRGLYFDVVRNHPLEVAQIYALNIGQVMSPRLLPGIGLALAAMVGGLALLRTRRRELDDDMPVIPVAVVTTVLTLLHAAQAVLAVPTESYFFQAYVGCAMLGAIAADIWWRVFWGRERLA